MTDVATHGAANLACWKPDRAQTRRTVQSTGTYRRNWADQVCGYDLHVGITVACTNTALNCGNSLWLWFRQGPRAEYGR
jgi:hypothetical protein